MRINEYNCLYEFIYEYDSGRHPSTDYRMCYEPPENEGEPRFYFVYVMHCESHGYPAADNFEVIGRYKNIQDLLNNCLIGGTSFKDVIMDDNTKILGQD